MRYLFIVMSFLFVFSFKGYAYILYWFSGAGISRPAQKIANLYNATHKNRVVVITGGSGEVLNKMIESKKGDVYTFVDYLFLKKALKYKIVTKYERMLKLTPVFLVSQAAKNKIKNIYDLAKPGIKIAGGNKKAMCLGKTFERIVNKFPPKLSNEFKKNIAVRCLNVFQVIGYIKNDTVDAGLVLDRALIKDANLGYVAIPNEYNVNRYGYAALVSYSKHKDEAKELFDYILKHMNVYKQAGFHVMYR